MSDLTDAYTLFRSDKDGPTSGDMKSVKGLVVHHTGGHGDVNSVVNALWDRTNKGVSVGATFVMDRDGAVYRIVPEGKRTWHASGYNTNYEGIEVIANNDGDITPEQVEGFRKFALWHSTKNGYTVSPETVFGHGEISAKKRATEGATLKWTLLQSQGFTVPATVKIGDKGNGDPAMKFADAPAWIRRPPMNIPTVASELSVERARAEQRGGTLTAPSAAPLRLPMDKPSALAKLQTMKASVAPPLPRPRPTPPGQAMAGDIPLPRPRPSNTPPQSVDDVTFTGMSSLIESSAAFGIEKPSRPTNPADLVMTPGQQYTGQAKGDTALFTDRRLESLAANARLGMPGVTTPAVTATSMQETRAEQRASDRLRVKVSSIYAGTPQLPAADDPALEDGVPGKSTRPPTVLPKGTVGRWEISPQRIADNGTLLKAPTLSTSIAFAVKAPTSKSVMALSFDRFTMPPEIAAKPVAAPVPALKWELLDGPAFNESMQRREQWIASKPATPKPAAKTEVRTDPVVPRAQAAQTTLSTVKTPTGAPASSGPTLKSVDPVAPQKNAGAKIDAPVSRVAAAPTVKPTTKTVTSNNPAYLEYVRKYGQPIAAPTLNDTMTEQNLARRVPGAQEAPPPPPQFIQTRVPVEPKAAPSRESALSGGLYTVGPGDTLSAISKRTGVSVSELARINNIKDVNKIYAGDTIRVSSSSNPVPMGAPVSKATQAVAASGAQRAATSSAASSSSGSTFSGSSTGTQYVVGQIYVNSQGVQKMAMPDGSFKRI